MADKHAFRECFIKRGNRVGSRQYPKRRCVRIGAWADVGTNAVILPGVTVGKGSIVGAGAVVTKDVLPFSIVAGVPAKFLRWRDGYQPEGE